VQEARLFLIEIYCEQLKAHWRAPLYIEQGVPKAYGCLAPERHTMIRSPSAIIAKSSIASPM